MSIRYDEANRIFELDFNEKPFRELFESADSFYINESPMKRGLSDIYIMDRRFVRRNVISF
mgnify:CR=1 FL=1